MRKRRSDYSIRRDQGRFVQVTNHSGRAQPVAETIYGRFVGERSGVWHVFEMTGRSIGATRCGRAFRPDVELSDRRPRSRLCARCQRDQGTEVK